MKKIFLIILTIAWLPNTMAMNIDLKTIMETEPAILRKIAKEWNQTTAGPITPIISLDYAKFRHMLQTLDNSISLTPAEERSELWMLMQYIIGFDRYNLNPTEDNLEKFIKPINKKYNERYSNGTTFCNTIIKNYFRAIHAMADGLRLKKITPEEFGQNWNALIVAIDNTLAIAQRPKELSISKNRFSLYVNTILTYLNNHHTLGLFKTALPIYSKRLESAIMKTAFTPPDEQDDFLNGIQLIMRCPHSALHEMLWSCLKKINDQETLGHFMHLLNTPSTMQEFVKMDKAGNLTLIKALIDNSAWTDEACIAAYGELLFKYQTLPNLQALEKSGLKSMILNIITQHRPHLADNFKKDYAACSTKQLRKNLDAFYKRHAQAQIAKQNNTKNEITDPITSAITDINELAARGETRALALTKFKLTIQSGKYNADQVRRLFNEVKLERFDQTVLAQARSEIVDACKKCSLNDQELFAKLGTEPAPSRPMTTPKKSTAKKSSMNTPSKKSGGKKSKPKKTNGKKTTTNENEKNKKLSQEDTQDKEISVSIPTTSGVIEYRLQERERVQELSAALVVKNMGKVKKLLKQGVVPTEEMAHDIMQYDTSLLSLLLQAVPAEVGKRLQHKVVKNIIRKFLKLRSPTPTASARSERVIQPINIDTRLLRSTHYETLRDIFAMRDKVKWSDVANLMRELSVECKHDSNRIKFKFADGERIGGHLHHNDEQDVLDKNTLRELKDALEIRGIRP